MDLINPIYTSSEAREKLRKDFDTNIPYRHIILDDFLNQDIADEMYANFPSMNSLNVRRKSINENKAEDYHFEGWHTSFSKVKEEVRSKAFYQWMAHITGIKGLRTTTDSLGSGIHQGTNGSYVDIHIDANMNPKAGLWRRVNLLIYLNKKWKKEYGGHLELWDKKMKILHRRVTPNHNRAIIFYSDENSPHGYSRINVPDGETRKSFYTYYYSEIGEGFRYSDSRFLPRSDEPLSKRLTTKIKETVKIRVKRFLYTLGIKSLDFQDKNKKS